MNVTPHSAGGYLCRVTRADRATALQTLVAAHGPIVAITPTRREAEDLGERLRLSGVPVMVMTDPNSVDTARSSIDGERSSVIATQEWVLRAAPLEANLVVHTRLCRGARDYARRLRAVQSPVHLSFVVPEDERAVEQLSVDHPDPGHGETADIDLRSIVAEASDVVVAAPAISPRRRFPLAR